LEAARGRKEFAAGVDELWRSAREGRVGLLAVEENLRLTVRDDGEHLVLAEEGDLDAREDIVDEIVEQCLETGAGVRFVPDGTLGDEVGMAGLRRFCVGPEGASSPPGSPCAPGSAARTPARWGVPHRTSSQLRST